jgi:hypothetical protein
MTREPQYATCFSAKTLTAGPMTSYQWETDPKRVLFGLSRYKFVAQMFKGLGDVAEIGCADGFGSHVVSAAVGRLALFDFDPAFVTYAGATVHDILDGPLPPRRGYTDTLTGRYDGIYLLDVLEHIRPENEGIALANIVASLQPDGACIIGMPSLESQAYASEISKAGHVNCKTGEQLRMTAKRHFRNVFLFGMNDEVLHTGFAAMCHYLLVLCTGPLPRRA